MLPTPRLVTSAAKKRIAPMTIQIPTPQQLRKVLKYNPKTGKLFWRRRDVSMFSHGYRDAQGNCNNWNSRYSDREAFNSFSKGYLIGGVFGKRMKAHRVAWAIHYGKWPTGQIDHINGKRDDNRIENLRDVSGIENHRNMKRPLTNTTGHIGVYAHGDKWRVKVKNIHIGVFDSFENAVSARFDAASRLGFHKNHGR